MFTPLRLSAIKEMEDLGNITVSIKKGWEGSATALWSSTPAFVTYWLHTNGENIFSCYYSREGNTSLQLTNLEATKLISDKKALVDAYLYVALKGLMGYAKTMGIKQLKIDSYISSLPDHMLDLGFRITPKGTFGATGCRGCKILEE